MREKEDEKVEKYLVSERFEKCEDVTKVLLVVMRTLGSVPMNVKNNLKVIDVEISVKMTWQTLHLI